MKNFKLDEKKWPWHSILLYLIALMAESEEELKSLLMKVKSEIGCITFTKLIRVK